MHGAPPEGPPSPVPPSAPSGLGWRLTPAPPCPQPDALPPDAPFNPDLPLTLVASKQGTQLQKANLPDPFLSLESLQDLVGEISSLSMRNMDAGRLPTAVLPPFSLDPDHKFLPPTHQLLPITPSSAAASSHPSDSPPLKSLHPPTAAADPTEASVLSGVQQLQDLLHTIQQQVQQPASHLTPAPGQGSDDDEEWEDIQVSP